MSTIIPFSDNKNIKLYSNPNINDIHGQTPNDIIENEKEANSDNVSENSEGSRNYQILFKVILIGDSGIGKTSIINRYVNNIYTEKYLCTIGVDFLTKSFEIEDVNIKLQIWDTAGMERYRQITTSYYRGANAAVIAFDLTNRKSFENIKKWINLYYEYSNPLISKSITIVGNKSDLIAERSVKSEEIEELLKINTGFSYEEVSAKTGENIDSIFDKIALRLFKELKTTGNLLDIKDKNHSSGSYKSINSFELIQKRKKCKC